MLKATAGGGGKGLRLVKTEGDLRSSLRMAKSEAKSAFSDDSVYIEKNIENPRHVEIQILGDRHGNYVHLCERECSIQRRHQKVIEESPSVIVTPEIRAAMGGVEMEAAAGVQYGGGGATPPRRGEEATPPAPAIECRVYAEDPDNNFMPCPGLITSLRTPGGPCVRDDSGVFEGFEIPIYYDPIISKLVVL